MADYDRDNIFARILRGEVPCHKVYEDDHTLAFMDIAPRTDGHALVIPKAPARTLLDIGSEDIAHVARTTRIVARAATTAFDAEGVTILQANERAGGQVVFHLHVHVMPRWTGVALKPAASEMAKPDVLTAHAARLKAAIEALSGA